MLRSQLSRSLLFPQSRSFADSKPPSLTVKTKSGKVLGKSEGNGARVSWNPVCTASGGARCAGSLRCPAAKWHGVRLASEFGSHCMQLPLFKDMVFRDPGISEDCLTLNVWDAQRRTARPSFR